MANPIHEWLADQEADSSLSLEQFYARIKGAVEILKDRLEVGEDEGIDTHALEGEE